MGKRKLCANISQAKHTQCVQAVRSQQLPTTQQPAAQHVRTPTALLLELTFDERQAGADLPRRAVRPGGCSVGYLSSFRHNNHNTG